MQGTQTIGKPKIRIVQRWHTKVVIGEEAVPQPDGTVLRNHTYKAEPRSRVAFIGSEKAFEIWKKCHVMTPDMEINPKFHGVSGLQY